MGLRHERSLGVVLDVLFAEEMPDFQSRIYRAREWLATVRDPEEKSAYLGWIEFLQLKYDLDSGSARISS
jgi:hypothetical protein